MSSTGMLSITFSFFIPFSFSYAVTITSTIAVAICISVIAFSIASIFSLEDVLTKAISLRFFFVTSDVGIVFLIIVLVLTGITAHRLIQVLALRRVIIREVPVMLVSDNSSWVLQTDTNMNILFIPLSGRSGIIDNIVLVQKQVSNKDNLFIGILILAMVKYWDVAFILAASKVFTRLVHWSPIYI